MIVPRVPENRITHFSINYFTGSPLIITHLEFTFNKLKYIFNSEKQRTRDIFNSIIDSQNICNYCIRIIDSFQINKEGKCLQKFFQVRPLG